MHTWHAPNVTIYQANMLDVTLPESPDIIITSPPYNLGMSYSDYHDAMPYADYLAFTRAYLSKLRTQARPHTRLCLNVPFEISAVSAGTADHKPLAADVCRLASDANWTFRHCLVWHKHQVGRRTAFGSYQRPSAPMFLVPCEALLIFYAEKWKRSARAPQIDAAEYQTYTLGFWDLPGVSNPHHPAVFPIEIPRRLLKVLSYPDDVVYDPFCGTGTTLRAAQELGGGRRAYGCDISEKYCRYAATRCGQLSFDEVSHDHNL